MSELYRRTLERQRYLEDRGYRVVCMWECEYKHMRKTDENLQEFRLSYKQEPNGRSGMSVELGLAQYFVSFVAISGCQMIKRINFQKCALF